MSQTSDRTLWAETDGEPITVTREFSIDAMLPTTWAYTIKGLITPAAMAALATELRQRELTEQAAGTLGAQQWYSEQAEAGLHEVTEGGNDAE